MVYYNACILQNSKLVILLKAKRNLLGPLMAYIIGWKLDFEIRGYPNLSPD